jgi:hypothetical protein
MRITKITERWFDVPNDPDNARLKIKHLSPGEIQDIFDKVFVQKIDYKKGKGKKAKLEPIFSQKTDKKLDRELTLTMTVIDWEGFFDKKDQPMVCTPENIIRASRQIEGFNELVTELREQLAEDIQKEKESQQGNLLSSAPEPVK